MTVFQPSSVRQVVSADPAANAEATITVAATKMWRLLTVTITCVQGLTQTPQPILTVDDGANTLFETFGSSAAQAVSTTCVYTWAPTMQLSGQVGTAANIHSTAPLPPDMVLAAGSRIRTNTLGIGANTDYGVMRILVAEFNVG